MKNASKSVEYDFQSNFELLKRCRLNFHDEVTLAHRLRVDASSQEIQGHVRSLSDENYLAKVHTMKKEAKDHTKSLLAWLNPVDVYSDLDYASQKQFPGTGNWILKTDEFHNWRNVTKGPHESYTGIIWINGRPGTGKTVLSSTMIRSLHIWEDQKASQAPVIGFFYCDSGDSEKRSALHICASILAQIACQLPYIPAAITEAYERARRYGRLHASLSDDLFTVLEKVALSLPSLFVVLDGLDECEEPSSTVTAFASIARKVKSFRLCFLSRRIPAIETSLHDAVDIQLKNELVQPDINTYLHASLDQLPGKGSQVNQEAFKNISDRADGMFLFATLSVQSLRQAIDIQSMSAAVKQIPQGLNGTYSKILDGLFLETLPRRLLAREVFLWVCGSTRPLSWRELQYALSWNSERKCFLEDQRPFKDSVLELCSPLVEYRADRDSFHLAHFSVREFLCRNPAETELSKAQAWFSIDETIANLAIAETTIACLASPEVINTVSVDIFQHPLIKYATLNWCHHLTKSAKDIDINQRYLEFVANPSSRSTWIMRYLLLDKESFPLQRLSKLQKSLREQKSTHTNQPLSSAAEDLGDLQRALILLDELPASITKNESISNFERLMCVRDLAREYTMANKLPQGIELFTKALHNIRNNYSDDCTQIPWILNSLGILYDQQNNTELATSLQRQALAIQEKLLPPDHLDTTLTINELGRMTRHLGLYKEAETCHLRALHILRGILPESDLQIVWTINTLARSYRREGRLEEALVLHRQALAGQISLLGERHPHVLWTMGDIARCLKDQGNVKEGIEMLEKVRVLREMELGALHPDALWTVNNLGLYYEALGDFKRARELHREALKGQTEALGLAHPHAVWSEEILARLEARA